MNSLGYTGMIRQMVFVSLLFFSICCHAQTEEKSTYKIELSVKTKDGVRNYPARSLSLAFGNPSKGISAAFPPSEDPSKTKKYFIAVDFETMDNDLLALLTDYDNELSGESKVRAGKDDRLIQKIEFSGASLDNFSGQSSADDTHAFIYLWCKEITVNGVKLK